MPSFFFLFVNFEIAISVSNFAKAQQDFVRPLKLNDQIVASAPDRPTAIQTIALDLPALRAIRSLKVAHCIVPGMVSRKVRRRTVRSLRDLLHANLPLIRSECQGVTNSFFASPYKNLYTVTDSVCRM